jgi:hypothetical protein
MLFEKIREKDQPLTKCGMFPVKTVLKSQFCQPFVMQGGVRLVILFVDHPASAIVDISTASDEEVSFLGEDDSFIVLDASQK